IMQNRCVSCHSEHPTDELFTTPPKGVLFNTPEQIAAQADLIYKNAVVSPYMPLGNKTGMLDEERELLGQWITQGANIE
ncbi:MAG: hypothetical protein KC422_04070, partial [Trueperaceae bacterium]|nr:hypothetical protein [Trueperaceae bacterium]